MPKVNHVKARKDYPEQGIAKGEMCYVWSLKTGRGGTTYRSKHRPRPSQLTTSGFLQTFYGIQEAFEYESPGFSELESSVEDVKGQLEELRDETQGNLDNMPEGLQGGPTGQLLQERIDALESIIGDLESIDFTVDYGGQEDEDEKENIESARAEEIRSEVLDAITNGGL